MWPELILICTLKLELQEQEPVFLLEYVSWRGIPHYTIILFGFNAEGPNCSIRVFLLIAITVWGQERRCGIREENTPPVLGFHRPGVLKDEGLRRANIPEGQQLYYVWKERKIVSPSPWVTSCILACAYARVRLLLKGIKSRTRPPGSGYSTGVRRDDKVKFVNSVGSNDPFIMWHTHTSVIHTHAHTSSHFNWLVSK